MCACVDSLACSRFISGSSERRRCHLFPAGIIKHSYASSHRAPRSRQRNLIYKPSANIANAANIADSDPSAPLTRLPLVCGRVELQPPSMGAAPPRSQEEREGSVSHMRQLQPPCKRSWQSRTSFCFRSLEKLAGNTLHKVARVRVLEERISNRVFLSFAAICEVAFKISQFIFGGKNVPQSGPH